MGPPAGRDEQAGGTLLECWCSVFRVALIRPSTYPVPEPPTAGPTQPRSTEQSVGPSSIPPAGRRAGARIASQFIAPATPRGVGPAPDCVPYRRVPPGTYGTYPTWACPFLAASYDQWSPRGRRIRPRRRFGCRRQVDRYSRSRARQTGAHFACLLFFLKKRRGFVGRGAVNTRLRWPWAMDAPTAHVCPSPPTARPAAACPRNRGTVRDPDTTTPGLLN